MRLSAEMRDAFVVQVLANLVTVAILYLLANGVGLVARNTAGVAIAAVVITWALYGVLLQREILNPKAVRPSGAFILAAVASPTCARVRCRGAPPLQ